LGHWPRDIQEGFSRVRRKTSEGEEAGAREEMDHNQLATGNAVDMDDIGSADDSRSIPSFFGDRELRRLATAEAEFTKNRSVLGSI
jgi:hypothetical protein